MDPRLVQKWMDEGKLPNMKKLAARGSGVRPLGTTHSPESPTAWASFATGVNAGKHNIYDFLIRDTTHVPARPRAWCISSRRASSSTTSRSRSRWCSRSAAARRSGSPRATPASAPSMLTVPVTFPPEDVPNGELLSGLPLPDIRRTMGTFYYFGDRPEPLRRREHRVRRHPEAAGVRRRHRRRPSWSARRTRSSSSSCASCARRRRCRRRPMPTR